MIDDNESLVSIVIACYNHEKFVQDSIKSIIDQTYQNIELIIIDDGSKDNSVEQIQKMIPKCKERFVRFEFRHRPNKGLSATLNEALDWCEGEFYSPFASDDIMLPLKTEIQVNYLRNNVNDLLILGGREIIDENNRLIGKSEFNEIKSYTFEQIIMQKYTIYAPTLMARLSIIKNIRYDPTLAIEDWYMWLKISKINNINVLPNILIKYRWGSHNSSLISEKFLNDKMAVLSKFQHEPLYNEALKQLEFNNTLDIFKINKLKGFSSLISFAITYPTYIPRKTLRYFYNKF